MTQTEIVLSLLKGTQQLNSEIAALIKTADKMLSKRGFHHDGGAGVIKGATSASVDSPERWLPLRMYRMYQGERDLDDVIILNVVLGSTSKPELVQEPLVLCARFQYEKGRAVLCWSDRDAWDLWKHRAATEVNRVYTKIDLQKEIGSDRFLSESKWAKEEVRSMREVRFLAVPLLSITDSRALDRELLQRIL